MSLAEGVQGRVVYKAYATGAMVSNTQAVSATDPAATGGQILRRVGCSLALQKDTYQSAEIRSDRQIADFRHGVKRASGSITGELSPLTYVDLLEAAFRGTRGAAVAKSNTELTNLAFDGPTFKFTFGGGDPVAEGFRVGHIVRVTNHTTTQNNNVNFLVTGFSGASNRDMTVYPAPTTGALDATFNIVSVGKTFFPPATGHVSRKFAFEHFHSDVDHALLFTECRVAGFNFGLPATGLATVEIPIMGRDCETYSAGTAPFFTAPTAATTTGICAAVNGLIRVAGAVVGVVTGATINVSLAPSSDAVVGQNFVPEIFLGRCNVTGQLTAFFEDLTLFNLFKNETEAQVQLYLTTTSAANTPAISILLPRVKFGGAPIPLQGEGGQGITLPFQALKYETAVGTTGIENTTIFIADTEVV